MAQAIDFSVMTFNTMCDFCHKEKEDRFKNRRGLIKQVIEDHKADLVALQEVRTGNQVKRFFKELPQYKLIYVKAFLVSYADPALAINTEKFEVLDDGHFWLGPSDGFNLGWKIALPRQVIWAKIRSKQDQKEFIFASGHFDNRVENLLGASVKVNSFIKDQKLPVLFAGDTNLVPEFEGYSNLIGSELSNAFDLKEKFSVKGDPDVPEDFCYRRKGKSFPECRVDHVLLSKGDDWKVLDWMIDVRKLGDNKRFPSDHRAVINKISLN